MTLRISKNMTGPLGPFTGGLVPDNSNTDTTIQLLINAINVKEAALPNGSAGQYIRGDKTLGVLSKTLVGLSNVDNTSDTDKPISTLVMTALNGKEPNLPTGGTNAHYLRGDKTWATLGKVAVGLSNVDNTSDANKPISTAVQSALDLKASTALVTTTVSGLMVFSDKVKLNGIAAGATVNDTDANLKNRGNHTGNQEISTITGLQVALDAKANTAVATTTVNGLLSATDKVKINGIASGATVNATDSALRDRSTHTGTQAISTIVSLQSSLDGKESLSAKGQANGYAALGSDGKVPSINLPDNGSYKGNWNANTNTPTVVAGSGTNGDTYTVSVAGTQSVTGTSTAFEPGDQLKFTTNGNKWERVPNFQAVASVAGLTGPIASSALKTALTLVKVDVGLGNVDNTADVDKPISTAVQTALNAKASTAVATTSVAGLLSTSDKTKLDGISPGATVNATDSALRDRSTHTGNQAISTITNLQVALDAKEPSVVGGTASQFYRGDKTWQTLNAIAVGLGNVNNTSDVNKPISTSVQAALDTKFSKDGGIVSGTVQVTALVVDGSSNNTGGNIYFNTNPASTLSGRIVMDNFNDAFRIYESGGSARGFYLDLSTCLGSAGTNIMDRSNQVGSQAISTIANLQATLNAKEPTLVAGTSLQYYRGDKTWQALDKSAVGLTNVDNTSDASKPISTATTAALGLKANLASPTFTGTVSGITKAMVGLANVDNTADIAKPISSATQTALDGKQGTLVSGTSIKTVGGISLLGSGDAGTIGLAYGGTGSTTASAARANLNAVGLVGDETISGIKTFSDTTLVVATGKDVFSRVQASSGYTADIRLGSPGADLWCLRKSEAVQGGSDTGADFQIIRRGDSGSYLGVALTIARSTGNVSMGTLVSTGSVSGVSIRATGANSSSGGQLYLAKPTGGTLAGDVTIDTALDGVRIYENGGTARGYYIPLTSAASGAGTNILNRAAHIGQAPISSITNLQSNLDSINTKILRSQPNLLYNGGLEGGFAGVASSGGLSHYNTGAWGPVATTTTNGTTVFSFSPITDVQPNAQYWIHVDPIAYGASNVYCDMIFKDASGNVLLDGTQNPLTGPFDFSPADDRRGLIAATNTAPTGTASIDARVIITVVGNQIAGFRRAKVEVGPTWTPFSQERSLAVALSTANIVNGKLGSRSANIRDYTQFDLTGNTDMSGLYQSIIDQASVANVPVEAQACVVRLDQTIRLPQNHVFRGMSAGSGQGANPNLFSTFLIAHSGVGFTNDGGIGQGAIHIFDQSTRRIQPNVVTGQPWSPNDHDYDYKFNDVSNLKMYRILTQNATRGIYCNGNRNTIEDWSGQCYKKGLHVDWSYDTLNVNRVHLWPFEHLQDEVMAYTQANLIAFQLNRVDNPFFNNIFSIRHRYGFAIGWYPGEAPYKPAGTTSKLKLIGADIDIGDTAYWVQANADGHTAKFVAVSSQARDGTQTNQPMMVVEGPNCRITGDFSAHSVGGNGVRMTASSVGSRVSLLTNIKGYNTTAGGYPAIEVMPGGGQFDLLPGSILENGNGGAQTSGNVIVWQP